jgi:hypothetical protein
LSVYKHRVLVGNIFGALECSFWCVYPVCMGRGNNLRLSINASILWLANNIIWMEDFLISFFPLLCRLFSFLRSTFWHEVQVLIVGPFSAYVWPDKRKLAWHLLFFVLGKIIFFLFRPQVQKLIFLLLSDGRLFLCFPTWKENALSPWKLILFR